MRKKRRALRPCSRVHHRYLNAFGVFQEYYQQTFFADRSSSSIAWLGSFQVSRARSLVLDSAIRRARDCGTASLTPLARPSPPLSISSSSRREW